MPSAPKIYRTHCAGCGTPRAGKHADHCPFRGGAAANRKPHRTKPCAICGHLFGEQLPPSILAQRSTCGTQECKQKKLDLIRAPCTICGKPNRRTGATCSDACRKKAIHRNAIARVKKVPARQCEVCGEKFKRREHGTNRESIFSFAKRKVCGRECQRRLQAAAPKNCRLCGRSFEKRHNESHFYERTTCGYFGTCDSEPKEKTCKRCGRLFTRGQGQALANFRKQVICSHLCLYGAKLYELEGIKLTVAELAELAGVTYQTALYRAKRGGALGVLRVTKKKLERT